MMNQRQFTKLFARELRDSGFFPHHYCTMPYVSKILRCLQKAVIKSLMSDGGLSITNCCKVFLIERPKTHYNPYAKRYEDIKETSHRPTLRFNKAFIDRFYEFEHGRIDIDTLLGKELYFNRDAKRKF